MSYSDAARLIDRIPVTVVELVLDSCQNTFGTAPCTAVEGIAGKCYNTRATCQDAANYARGTKSYLFIEGREGLPLGINMIPSVISVSSAPTRITPGKGLGYRASVTVEFQDHTHHDRGIDPYFRDRSFDAESSGTFWTKLLARNPHYQNRPLRVMTGYMTDPWDWANFTTREYVIDRIEGPDDRGRVKVVAKDVLKLADDDRAVCPRATTGTLQADISDTATSLSLSTGSAAEYAGDEYVRIGDEIILAPIVDRTGDTFANLTRAMWGTEATSHSTDDNVQACWTIVGENVRDVIEELLVDFASVPSSYIDQTEWDDERTDWLSVYSLTTIISEPTGVNKLLGEITEQCQVMVWPDARAQRIRLKAIVPPKGTQPNRINDDEHFIADSVKPKETPADRVTQVWVLYDPANYAEDRRSNYQRLYVQQDVEAESADQYGDQRILVIESRWFDETSQSAVLQTAGRIFNARRTTPVVVDFDLDAKDLETFKTGDIVDMLSDRFVDYNGQPRTVRGIILEEDEEIAGTTVRYKLQTGVGTGRFGVIAPDTIGDYSAESETNRALYMFIAPDSGVFADGSEAYKVI